jgi:putative ubiquitin-RnfH superfamily antitoxin RatB of RatAB toxin-antitoxin module
MKIEVVYALPENARALSVELAPGATVQDALAASGFRIQNHAVGIFGKRVALEHPLADGDRVEIYRPLAMDPKEARKRRAQKRAKGRR